MKSPPKKVSVVLVFAVVLVLPFVCVQSAYTVESTAPENALSFLRDVVELDTTKYNAKLVSYENYPADASGVATAEVLYNLKSEGSTLEVICNFRNNALVSCFVNPLEGSPLFVQPATNVLDEAKSLLDRYQTFSKASYLQPMRDMLSTVTELKPITKTVDDVNLTIIIQDSVYIRWMKTVNGIYNMYNRMGLVFVNGAFKSFSDSWNRYPVGSADVNISKEEAISIAKKRAQSYSYEIGNITVSNFTILDEHISTWLTMQPRENALYPHWEILLPLDKFYPGMVTAIRVTLWADTGEVTSIKWTSGGGGPMPEEPPTTPSTEPPPDETDGLDPTPLIIAVPVALAITLGAMFYRKRRKH